MAFPLPIRENLSYGIGLVIWAGVLVFYVHFHQSEDWSEYIEAAVLEYYEAIHLVQTGTWTEIAALRRWKLLTLFPKYLVFTLPSLMAFFLWGFAAARGVTAGGLRDFIVSRAGIKGFMILLIAGMLFNLGTTLVWMFESGMPRNPGLAQFLTVLFYHSGVPLLMFAYLTGLAIWWGEGAGSFIRKGLSAVGRTALSNYLFQTIVGTTLFYGYGFAMYGRFGIAWIPVVAVAIFAVQMILSRCWIARFRFGPAEYLWRYLTYRGFRFTRSNGKE